MAKKTFLLDEAERLYIVMNRTLPSIAATLDVSLRTLTNWKSDAKKLGCDWDLRRAQRLAAAASFPDEIQELARELVRATTADLKEGREIPQSHAILLRATIGKAGKEKEYADALRKEADGAAEKKGPQVMSPETAKKIQKEILGLVVD